MRSWWKLAILFLVSSTAMAAKSLAIDLFAAHRLLKERLSAGEPFGSQIEKVHAKIRFRPQFQLKNSWELHTPISLLLPWDSGADGTVKVFESELVFAFSRLMSRRFSLAFGPGISWRIFVPTAGSVTLQNGNSTQTFYIPSQTQVTTQFVTHVEFSWSLSPRTSFTSNVTAKNLGDKGRMSFAIAIGMGVRL